MQYLNLNVSVLDSEAMIDADSASRGVWLMLQRYCAGQENNGRIAGARAWTDRKWQQIVRVSLDEINTPTALWRWEGDDLIAEFYPSAAQSVVQAKRYGATVTNHKRDAVRSAQRHAKKGREGKKEKEGMEENRALHSVEVSIPSQEEFVAHGESLGLPRWRIDEAWLTCCRDQWRRRNGVALDFRLELSAVRVWWESDGRPLVRAQKNGVGHGVVAELEKKIAMHPANRESPCYDPLHTPADEEALDELKRDRMRQMKGVS